MKDITKDILKELILQRKTLVQIAEYFQVSLYKVRKTMGDFHLSPTRAYQKKYPKHTLEETIKNSKCWREVIIKLNSKKHGGATQTYLKKLAQKFGIDFSHFVGMSWSKGLSLPKRRISYLEYVERDEVSSTRLKKMLIREGIKNKECERCFATDWLGEPVALHLHHIDSNHDNNDLNNLLLVCPNCHYFLHKLIRREKAKHKVKREREKKNNCKQCGAGCFNKFCSTACFQIFSRKVSRPYKRQLVKLLKTFSILKIAKDYNVTGNTVRKWCQYYAINWKKISPFSRISNPPAIKKNCEVCDEECENRFCSPKCSSIGQRKSNRPTKFSLIELLRRKRVTQIAQEHGVTGNAVRKWCESYDINWKKLSPFSKQNKKKPM